MSAIVFAGDSVTYGVREGVTTADTFAQKIGAARGFTSVVNAGVPNLTAPGGVQRFQTDVLSHAPCHVCLMYGINDVYYSIQYPGVGWDANYYKDSMLSMVRMAKDAGAGVTILTPNLVTINEYITAFPAYLDACMDVGAIEDVKVVDCYTAFLHKFFLLPRSQFDLLYTDSQHPSAAGHQLITDLVLKPWNAKACEPVLLV